MSIELTMTSIIMIILIVIAPFTKIYLCIGIRIYKWHAFGNNLSNYIKRKGKSTSNLYGKKVDTEL